MKTLNCILNRTASKAYTVIFLAIIMIVPSFTVLYFYLFIFIATFKSNLNTINNHYGKVDANTLKKGLRMLKGLFSSCLLFIICHLPFGLVVLSDLDDTYPDVAYMYTMLLAHLGSTLNVLLYALTNSQIRIGYINFLNLCRCSKKYSYLIKIDL